MLVDKARVAPPPVDTGKARRAVRQGGPTPQQVGQAAEDFEAVFLTQMLEHMFTGVGEDDPLKGPGDDIYRSMMLQEYGKLMAKTGGIGVADSIKRELLRTQEVTYDAGPRRNNP